MLSILIDNNTLSGFKDYLEYKSPDYFYLSSFAQFVESLVLSEQVFVDDMSFRISKIEEFLNFLNPELPKVVLGLPILDEDRASAVSFANDFKNKMSYCFVDKDDELQLLRAYFYSYISRKNGLPYFPHEKRAFFLSLSEEINNNYGLIFKKLFSPYDKLRYDAYQELKQKGLIHHKYRSLPFPQIFYYIVSKASNLLELIEIAIDLRDNKNAKGFRKFCNELVQAEINDDYISANRMFDEVETYLKRICTYQQTRYSAEFQFSFPLKMPSITLAGVPIDLKRKKYLLFLKQILSTVNYADIESKLNNILKI